MNATASTHLPVPKMPKRSRSYSRKRYRRRVRPRRYRKYRRVYRRRRTMRGRFSRRLRLPLQVQSTCFKKFRWTDTINTAILSPNNTFGGYRSYTLNTLFQPDSANTAAIPSLTEICGLYAYCKVMATKVSFKLEFPAQEQGRIEPPPSIMYIAAVPFGLIIPVPSVQPAWVSLRTFVMGNPRYCAYRSLGPFYHGPGYKVLKKYFKIGNLVANPLQFKASDDWNQPIGPTGPNAGPVNQQECTVGFAFDDALIANRNTAFISTVTLTFYVKFWMNRVELT